MKLMVIDPIGSTIFENETKEYFERFKEPSTEIEVRSLEHGPETIETYLDVALASPGIIDVVTKEKETFDAFIINCFADPGLDAAREISGKLVLGVAEVTMHVATIVANKFSVITTDRNSIPWTEIQALNYSVKDRLINVVAIDTGVKELVYGDSIYSKLLTVSQEEMKKGSEAIVFGCTRMSVFAERLQGDLQIPVLEPSKITLKFAEAMVKAGVRHSRFLKYSMTDSKRKLL
ncbi:MAG: aspartate/glutamate racemase family protein [Nitrososphaerota archaeon]